MRHDRPFSGGVPWRCRSGCTWHRQGTCMQSGHRAASVCQQPEYCITQGGHGSLLRLGSSCSFRVSVKVMQWGGPSPPPPAHSGPLADCSRRSTGHNVSMYCVSCAGRVATVRAWMWRALQLVPAALRCLQVAQRACRHWQNQGMGSSMEVNFERPLQRFSWH